MAGVEPRKGVAEYGQLPLELLERAEDIGQIPRQSWMAGVQGDRAPGGLLIGCRLGRGVQEWGCRRRISAQRAKLPSGLPVRLGTDVCTHTREGSVGRRLKRPSKSCRVVLEHGGTKAVLRDADPIQQLKELPPLRQWSWPAQARLDHSICKQLLRQRQGVAGKATNRVERYCCLLPAHDSGLRPRAGCRVERQTATNDILSQLVTGLGERVGSKLGQALAAQPDGSLGRSKKTKQPRLRLEDGNSPWCTFGVQRCDMLAQRLSATLEPPVILRRACRGDLGGIVQPTCENLRELPP